MSPSESSNAYQVKMAAVFKGQGDDVESARAAAQSAAESSVYGGDWSLESTEPIGGLDAKQQLRCEFTITSIISAASPDDAIDIAVEQLSSDWEVAGEPIPVS
jgi:hypothetical protein